VGGADARIVLAAKSVRTFCYGYLGILLPLHLAGLGVTATGIGASVTLTLAASAMLTWAVRRPAERYGARTVLAALAALSLVSALLLLVADRPALVVLAAMLGNIAVGVGETGPFLALEQVVVARAVSRDGLTMASSIYHLAGYVAAALGAAAASLLPLRVLFVAFAVGAVLQVVAYARLRDAGRPVVARSGPIGALPSAPIIRRLAALFALDSLAGGLVVQSLIAYWFHERYGLELQTLGPIFFASQLLSAASFLAAARLASRIGLVNTMVSTHLLSNVFLIGIGLAPSAPLAVAMLLARQLLSQMDVPTRQAYVMTVVEDHEREAASSATNLSRTVAQAVAPTFAGYAMQGLAMSAPFVLGGVLKIVYDLLLYASFRRIPPR
jgi:MFS family permease